MISRAAPLQAPAWFKHRPLIHPSRWLPAISNDSATLAEPDSHSAPAGTLSATRAHTHASTTTPHPMPLPGRGHPGEAASLPSPATSPAKLRAPSPLTRMAKDLELLARADRRNRRKWQRIVEAGSRAADLDESNNPHSDADPPPPGFESWREYQIACDFRKPGKFAPAYVQVAARMADAGMKADAHTGPPPSLNVDVQIVLRKDVHEYPVVDLDPVRRR